MVSSMGLFLQLVLVGASLLPSATALPVRCKDTLPPWVICDGVKDCPDGSDESPQLCSPKTYKCSEDDSSRRVACPKSNPVVCIDELRLCDGNPNCPGGTDEDPSFCTAYDCGLNVTGLRMKCPGSPTQCVPGPLICNGIPDCPNGTDEEPKYCAKNNCTASMMGWLDAASGTDAVMKCKGSNICYPGDACDGVLDCPDGSDEARTLCSNCTALKKAQCPGMKYHCMNKEDLCNGGSNTLRYCPDGSDESDFFCSQRLCKSGFIHCYGECSPGKLCDGKSDCDDGFDEDEASCSTYVCPKGSFKCRGSHICTKGAICDGKKNCPDGSDEARCTK